MGFIRKLYKGLKNNLSGLAGAAVMGYAILYPVLTGTKLVPGDKTYWSLIFTYAGSALLLTGYASRVHYLSEED